MAVLAHTHKPTHLQIAASDLFARTFLKLHLRRCMAAALGAILSGLIVPFMAAIEIVPLNLPVFFICLVLTAIGGGLALFFCGEI